jgi:hypothetical protein
MDDSSMVSGGGGTGDAPLEGTHATCEALQCYGNVDLD